MNSLISPEIDNSKELETLELYFTGLMKPRILADVKENENVLTDNAFQQMRSLLEENGQNISVDITLYEFINKCLFIEKRYEQKNSIPAGRA